MLTLQLSDFMVELKEGALHNVGPSNKSGSAKLFDTADVAAREFGDKRVKIVATDDEGNEVQIALFPAEARALAADLESLEDESRVFE